MHLNEFMALIIHVQLCMKGGIQGGITLIDMPHAQYVELCGFYKTDCRGVARNGLRGF